MMSKTRFRAGCYFLAAFLPPLAASMEKASTPKDYIVAVIAAAGTAFVALRAYADQTPATDTAHDPEPSVSAPATHE